MQCKNAVCGAGFVVADVTAIPAHWTTLPCNSWAVGTVALPIRNQGRLTWNVFFGMSPTQEPALVAATDGTRQASRTERQESPQPIH